jgi:hypothetical protein
VAVVGGEGGFTVLSWRGVAQLWESLSRAVFSLGGRHQSRSRAAWRRGEAGGGEGRKSPNKEGSDDALSISALFFLISNTFETIGA